MTAPIGDDPDRDRIWLDEDGLGKAREWLREQAGAAGAKCPCCKRFTKIYKRSINAGMARGLVIMYREHGTDWQDKIATLRAAGVDGREESKLRWWQLVAEDSRRREDGGHAGWWRVTELGEAFIREQRMVPKYAVEYDGNCLGHDGEMVSIRDCLGDKFDLRELLDTPARPLLGGR